MPDRPTLGRNDEAKLISHNRRPSAHLPALRPPSVRRPRNDKLEVDLGTVLAGGRLRSRSCGGWRGERETEVEDYTAGQEHMQDKGREGGRAGAMRAFWKMLALPTSDAMSLHFSSL